MSCFRKPDDRAHGSACSQHDSDANHNGAHATLFCGRDNCAGRSGAWHSGRFLIGRCSCADRLLWTFLLWRRRLRGRLRNGRRWQRVRGFFARVLTISCRNSDSLICALR